MNDWRRRFTAVSPVLHKNSGCDLSGMNGRVAYKPRIIFILGFLLTHSSLLGLPTYDLSSASLATNVKPRHGRFASGTPFVNNAPKTLADNLKGLLVDLELFFSGKIWGLPPLLKFLG